MDVHEFAAMIEETPVRSRVIEYHRPRAGGHGRELVAVCLTDVLSDGLSMVYSFFEPDLAARSLGSYIILDHIALAREAGLPYVYLGYWVPGSPKMDYKKRFQPLEIFVEGRWTLLGQIDVDRIKADRRRPQRPHRPGLRDQPAHHQIARPPPRRTLPPTARICARTIADLRSGRFQG